MTTPLITRLEEAAAGSRELDCQLAREFGWHRVEPRYTRNRAGGWIAPEDFSGVNSDGSPRLDSLRGTDIHRDPPRLSQSLDAALDLAERVLPGWEWLLRTDDERGFMLNCWRKGDEPNRGDECFPSYATTLPLAFCLAILKANHKDKP